MNKKKLVIMMLVLVMVLSLAITALVGCDDKGKEDIDGYNQASSISIEDALTSAIYNSAEDGNLNNFKVGAQLALSVNNHKYVIKLNANLALDEESQKTNSNSFGLSFVDATANANILNVYYNEGYSKTYGELYKDFDDEIFEIGRAHV